MGPDDAKGYVLSLATHLKQTEAALKGAEVELRLWEERLARADQLQQPDLRVEAEKKREGIAERKANLEREVQDFRLGVEKIKKQLLLLPLTQRSVNTDVLQENLAKLGGTLDPVTPVVKKLQADEALAIEKRVC